METYGSAIILCGGKSSRMGFDKCKIKIGESYLIELIAEKLGEVFGEIIFVADNESKFKDFDYRVAVDLHKNCGPAGGIYTGLKAASSKYVFVTACDMPYVNIGLIRHMISIIKDYRPDCIISRNGKWIEPFYAFYSRDMIDTFNKSINNNNFKLFEIIKSSNIYYIDEETVRTHSENLEVFINLNYFKDLSILEKIYHEEVNIYGKHQRAKYNQI